MNISNIVCPLCKQCIPNTDTELLVKDIVRGYDYLGIDVRCYFASEKKIKILKCKKTGYRFYYPYIKGDNNFYSRLSTNNEYYKENKWEYDYILNFLSNKNKTNILDIGCGNGDFMLKVKGFNLVEGVDFNDKSISSCLRKNLKVYKTSLNPFVFNTNYKYDYITCFQVIEHIDAVNVLFANLISLLNPGGYLIISVPNNAPYLYMYDKYHTLNLPPHHLGLWNKRSLKAVPTIFNNLSIVKTIVEPFNKISFAMFIRILLRNRMSEKNIIQFIVPFVFPFAKLLRGINRNIIVIYQKELS